MRGAEQVVGALAVLEPEDAVAVLGPAAGRLVGLARQQRRELQLLGADRVHLLADDPLDVAQHPQAQRQPGVDAGRGPPDVAGAHQQPVARHLGVRRVLPQGAHEQARHPQDHARKANGRSVRTAHRVCRVSDGHPVAIACDRSLTAPVAAGQRRQPEAALDGRQDRRRVVRRCGRRRSACSDRPITSAGMRVPGPQASCMPVVAPAPGGDTWSHWPPNSS